MGIILRRGRCGLFFTDIFFYIVKSKYGRGTRIKIPAVQVSAALDARQLRADERFSVVAVPDGLCLVAVG